MDVNCKINVNIHMSHPKLAAAWLLPWLMFAFTAASAQNTVKTNYTQARLLSEQPRIEPGRSFWLALQLAPEPGWHTYWKNPGDAGKATTIEWRLPPGLKAGPLHWPYPQRIRSGPLVSFGYTETATLLTEISGDWPSLNAGDTLEISAAADWLVCEEICIPESAVLNLSLPVGPGSGADPETSRVFSMTRERLPRVAEWTAHYIYKDNQLIFDAPWSAGAALETVLFFPVEDNLMENSSSQSFLLGKNTLRVSVGAGYLRQTGPFHGVLVSKHQGRDALQALEFTAEPVPQLPKIIEQ